jgi:hypothetical protein
VKEAVGRFGGGENPQAAVGGGKSGKCGAEDIVVEAGGVVEEDEIGRESADARRTWGQGENAAPVAEGDGGGFVRGAALEATDRTEQFSRMAEGRGDDEGEGAGAERGEVQGSDGGESGLSPLAAGANDRAAGG